MSDEIAEIRARHSTGGILSGNPWQTHADRGWLLDEIERLRKENERLSADVGRLLVAMRKIELTAAESYLPHEIVLGSDALEDGR